MRYRAARSSGLNQVVETGVAPLLTAAVAPVPIVSRVTDPRNGWMEIATFGRNIDWLTDLSALLELRSQFGGYIIVTLL